MFGLVADKTFNESQDLFVTLVLGASWASRASWGRWKAR